ncbi:MAG: prephenate dehydratase [Oscillospiraceae bacterium]|nr:prephenate dehydratase [Oscillospiraceae bacterium]
MKVGYLGPVGTNCHEACSKHIKNTDVEIIAFKSISDTILAVSNGEVDKCIVPIENSTQGSVLETIDILLENDKLNIIEELTLDINHCLLAKSKCNKENIKEIYSHPQALSQCRNYIIKNFNDCILKPVESTAAAAEAILDKENCACIANKICGNIYGLEILEENIQDINNNQTKFIIISLEENLSKEKAKTSMVFSTKNKPGELYKILGLFNIFDINLTKIESRPAKTKIGEYIFWVDFVGNRYEEHIKILLTQIEERCSFFRILGSY